MTNDFIGNTGTNIEDYREAAKAFHDFYLKTGRKPTGYEVDKVNEYYNGRIFDRGFRP